MARPSTQHRPPLGSQPLGAGPPVSLGRPRPVDRLERLLDAACEVMVSLGLHRFRLADVGRAAGVSHGLVTYYFGTRNALIRAAVAHAGEAGADRADRLAARAPDGRNALRLFLLAPLSNDLACRTSWNLWRQLWDYSLFE